MLTALITLSFSPYWIPSLITSAILIWVSFIPTRTSSMHSLFDMIVAAIGILFTWLVFFATLYFVG